MFWVNLFAPLLAFVGFLVKLFPHADTSAAQETVEPAARLVTWILQLNSAFPIVEGLAVLGAYMILVTALYGVMIVRRVWSLIWPGAGS